MDNTISQWSLAPDVIHLNHGSFGACPIRVLERQAELRAQMERDPMSFFVDELRALLDEARQSLAGLVGCRCHELAFVPNATSAVNAILRSFPFTSGDQIITTDHAYNACRNVLNYVAQQQRLKVVVVNVPLPVGSEADIVNAVAAQVTSATRLALLDHITSPTAVVCPIAELVATLEARGVSCLVDGAHAPGMLPLSIDEIGASFYTGNCHKWLCAPKGCAFLHASEQHHHWIVPPVLSHGWNIQPDGTTRFHAMFDWIGTVDPTPWLCIPTVLQFWAACEEGGVVSAMEANRQLLLAAVRLMSERVGAQLVCPPSMLGTMASLRLPDRFGQIEAAEKSGLPTPIHPLQRRLFDEHRIHVPVVDWKQHQLLLRISAQRYNRLSDYQKLAEALTEMATAEEV